MKPEKFKKLLTEYESHVAPWEQSLERLRCRLKAAAGQLEGEVLVLEEELPVAVERWAQDILMDASGRYEPVTKIRQFIVQKKAALADLDAAWKLLRGYKADLDTFRRYLQDTAGHLKAYKLALIEAAKSREQAAVDPDLSERAADAAETAAWREENITYNLEEAEGLLQAAEDLRFIKKRSPQK